MITLPLVLFLAGSPGPLEVLVICAVVLILFGPRNLPSIARTLGRMLSELRKASEDFRSQMMSIGESCEESTSTLPEKSKCEKTQPVASDAERADVATVVSPANDDDFAASDEIENGEDDPQDRSVLYDDRG